jgi:transposase
MEPYLEQIILWRTSPEYDFNGTRIFRELKQLGYTGTINPLYRILKQIDEKKSEISPRASVRIETPPGDQAQFDWSPYQMWIGNRIRTVYCFTMILAAIRKKAMCFSLSSNASSI